MLFYVASGFSGKAAALQQDRQRIRRTEFHVFIPIVPVERLVSFDLPVLVGEPKEIVRNAVKDDVLNNLKRVSEYGIVMLAGKVIVRYRSPVLVDPEWVWVVLMVLKSPVHDELQPAAVHPLAEDHGVPSAQ